MTDAPPASPDTAALLRAALLRHASDKAEEAEPLYRQILAREPAHPQALGMLGLILSEGPHEAEAEDLLRRHVAAAPDAGASLHALGRLKSRQGDDQAAAGWLERAAAALPRLAPAHNDLGACLYRLGRTPEALTALERAAALDPAYAVPHANRGLALHQAGRFDEAVDALLAALACASAEARDLRGSILHQLVKAARKAGRGGEAEAALRDEIAAGSPDGEVVADLAALLEQEGRRAEGLALRNGLARRAGLKLGGRRDAPAACVLVLGAVGGGHTPTRYLVDPQVFATLSLTLLSPGEPDAPLGGVDFAALEQADLVFSTLGDIDHDGGQFAAAEAFCARLGKPVLNPPASIARTGRDRAAALFAGVPGMVTPQVTRTTPEALADLPIDAPILARPAGDHGGDNLMLLESPADAARFLETSAAERLLLTPFHDFRSADGYWRKYRLIFVDRQVFPYHLAIGEHWLAHYWRAEMGRSPWKMAEEEAFLADWRGVFGPVAAAAAETAARRLDLDYGGMDCALTPDGELLLFEANACVLLHLDEPAARFGYKHRHVPPIREAFTRLALTRAEAAGPRAGSPRAGTSPAGAPAPT